MLDLLALILLIVGIVIIKKYKNKLFSKHSKQIIILGIILIILPSVYIVREFTNGFIDGFRDTSIKLNQNID